MQQMTEEQRKKCTKMTEVAYVIQLTLALMGNEPRLPAYHPIK